MTEIASRPLLIVDDDPRVLQTRGELLADFDVEFVPALSADEAIARLGASAFRGVVTDGLEGEWTRVVDVADECDTPSILVSGSDEQVLLAKERGLVTFLKGSYRAVELMTFLETFGLSKA